MTTRHDVRVGSRSPRSVPARFPAAPIMRGHSAGGSSQPGLLRVLPPAIPNSYTGPALSLSNREQTPTLRSPPPAMKPF